MALGNRYECKDCGSFFVDTIIDRCPICSSNNIHIICKNVRVD